MLRYRFGKYIESAESNNRKFHFHPVGEGFLKSDRSQRPSPTRLQRELRLVPTWGISVIPNLTRPRKPRVTGRPKPSTRESGSLATQATAIKLQLVLQITIPTILCNLLFEMLHRTGDIENFHRPAVSANQVVLMAAFAKTVVSGPAVETDAANDPVFLEASDQPVNRGRIAVGRKLGIVSDLLQGHRSICGSENRKARPQGTCPPESRLGTGRKQNFDVGRCTAHGGATIA